MGGWRATFTSVRKIYAREIVCIRGLPHYKQLNFGGGSDWLGAIAAALMDTTQAGDKNNVVKSQVLPHDEPPLIFPWKFRNLGSVLFSREKPANRFVACF